MSTTDTPLPLEGLKQIQQFIWSQGDYSQLAREIMPAAQALVEALDVRAGERLLDVAAGDGNVAVAAARRGARVVATDLTPAMLDLGRARTAGEGLDIGWQAADAEALPFEDASFDCVTSCFGAMFAPRPEVAAAELFRVARPGGRVGVASWTPTGFIGRFMHAIIGYLPAQPEGVPRPTDWGVADVARARLEPLAAEVELELRSVSMTAPSVEAALERQEQLNGPLVAGRALIGDRYPDLRRELVALLHEANVARDGAFRVESEYLLATARKAG